MLLFVAWRVMVLHCWLGTDWHSLLGTSSGTVTHFCNGKERGFVRNYIYSRLQQNRGGQPEP